MLRLLKSAALLGAASLVVVPTLMLRAQPPAPAPTAARTDEKAAPKDQDAPKAKEGPRSSDPIERIKDEAMNRSKVMETLGHLADVIGPRLTGSPELKKANEWTRDTLAKWGLENAHLEAWGPFGRGWTLERFSAQVVKPQCIPLIAYPKAWSPGTGGPVKGEVVYFDPKNDADYEKYKGKLEGKIVLMSSESEVADRSEPLVARKTDKQLLDLADATEPGQRGGLPRSMMPPGRPSAAGGPASKNGQAAAKGAPPAKKAEADQARDFMAEFRARMQNAMKKSKFVVDEKAAALLDCSTQGDAGTLFVSQASAPVTSTFPFPGQGGARASVWDKDAPKMAPQITVAKEHYNRLVRMVKQGVALEMEIDLAVKYHDADLMAYNTIAEIPGTDLKDQVVMVGGHLDSWHSGTGTTDNAAGCAASMEAVRILKALDLKPRRTVRIGLWSGEEQGLLGSRAYVTKHFGKTPTSFFGGGGPAQKKAEPSSDQTREFENFSVYFNLDNGAGKIRGIYLQGNEALRPLFRRWLVPFRDLGAQTVTVSNTGGTDHQSFDGIGLPGFQFIQDELDYNTRTHHSNMDVFERAPVADMKQSSAVIAAFLYNAAMLDEKLTRKPATPAAPAAGARTSSR